VYLRREAVYLHAGTREGARALNLSGKTIDVRELRKLSAEEIEDCLCIYKDALRGRNLYRHAPALQRRLSFFRNVNSDGS
jgi:hypothetical protein